MSLITWNDNFRVNVREIDEQHKRWVEILNNLYDAMKEGKGVEKVARLLTGPRGIHEDTFHHRRRGVLSRSGYPFMRGTRKYTKIW